VSRWVESRCLASRLEEEARNTFGVTVQTNGTWTWPTVSCTAS